MKMAIHSATSRKPSPWAWWKDLKALVGYHYSATGTIINLFMAGNFQQLYQENMSQTFLMDDEYCIDFDGSTIDRLHFTLFVPNELSLCNNNTWFQRGGFVS